MIRAAALVAAALVLPASAAAAPLPPTAAQSLAIANTAWPESACAGRIDLRWTAPHEFNEPAPSKDGEYTFGGGCSIAVLDTLRGTARGCDVAVHEAGHAAEAHESGYFRRRYGWKLDAQLHTNNGSVLDPNPAPWHACHYLLTRRQQAFANVRELLPAGTRLQWAIQCTVGTTRCRAEHSDFQTRRYAIPAYGVAHRTTPI